MKLVIFTAVALVAALLYVPKWDSDGEVIYTWVFDNTGKLDVVLLLLEFAMIGVFAFLVYVFDKKLN